MISTCTFTLTPESIAAITNIVLAIATVALAVVTAGMIWETRKVARETLSIAETATKTLALEQMPILGIRDLRVEITRYGGETKSRPAISAIPVGIELFNA